MQIQQTYTVTVHTGENYIDPDDLNISTVCSKYNDDDHTFTYTFSTKEDCYKYLEHIQTPEQRLLALEKFIRKMFYNDGRYIRIYDTPNYIPDEIDPAFKNYFIGLLK